MRIRQEGFPLIRSFDKFINTEKYLVETAKARKSFSDDLSLIRYILQISVSKENYGKKKFKVKIIISSYPNDNVYFSICSYESRYWQG